MYCNDADQYVSTIWNKSKKSSHEGEPTSGWESCHWPQSAVSFLCHAAKDWFLHLFRLLSFLYMQHVHVSHIGSGVHCYGDTCSGAKLQVKNETRTFQQGGWGSERRDKGWRICALWQWGWDKTSACCALVIASLNRHNVACSVLNVLLSPGMLLFPTWTVDDSSRRRAVHLMATRRGNRAVVRISVSVTFGLSQSVTLLSFDAHYAGGLIVLIFSLTLTWEAKRCFIGPFSHWNTVPVKTFSLTEILPSTGSTNCYTKKDGKMAISHLIYPIQAERETLISYFLKACRAVALISTRREQRRHSSERLDSAFPS